MMVWRNFWRGFSGCKLWLIVIVDIRDREMYFSLSFFISIFGDIRYDKRRGYGDCRQCHLVRDFLLKNIFRI